jgi:hypothetical protein
MRPAQEKHQGGLPTARKIRRACSLELYRTAKRLKTWIPPEQMEAAGKLYYQKVATNLIWIHEHHSNRKVLADWFEENVAADIAALWEVDVKRLSDAFRDAFGG